MNLGQICRKTIGIKKFKVIAHYYRNFFFNIDTFIKSLPAFEDGASILDIGGGDGAIINQLLCFNPSLKVVMLDIAPNIGRFIDSIYESNIIRIGKCSLTQYLHSALYNQPDCILLADVLHHVPEQERRSFVTTIISMLKPGTYLIIKEIEPDGAIAMLSVLADKYISGDKKVALISRQNLINLVESIDKQVISTETRLFSLDRPNYSVIFKRQSLLSKQIA